MSEQLSELYPVALEMGLPAETFWNLSVNEIFDTLSNIRRRLLREEKQRIMDNFIQAQAIAVDISALLPKMARWLIPGIIIRNCSKRNRRYTKKQKKPASGKSTWKKEGRTTPNGTIDTIINFLRKRGEVRPWEIHFIRCRWSLKQQQNL